MPGPPFATLRAGEVFIDPDPEFAAELRARVVRALGGQVMARVSTTSAATAPDATTAGPRHGDVVYLSLGLPDIELGVRFYSAVVGWSVGGDGQFRDVPGRTVPMGLSGGHEYGTTFLCFGVDDIDAAVARVRELGGTATEPDQRPYGVLADCVDDQGVPFALWQLGGMADVAHGEVGHGDIVYLTHHVTDSARARAFYGPLLGWRFVEGSVADGWQIEGVAPMSGLHGGHRRNAVLAMYQVDDITAAVRRVVAAGGTAGEPTQRPYGISSDCVDDQGVDFHLLQP